MPYYVYVSLSGESKISIFTMAPETGKLTLKEDVALSSGPAPLAVDPGQNYLYAGLRSVCEIASFRIDRATGKLTQIGTLSLEADPCYLATDRHGRFLLSAYYGAGKVGVHPIGTDGLASDPPIEWRDTAPKAHCIMTDASNRFVLVPHVGESNVIFQFDFDEETGALSPNAVPKVGPPEGYGPRHYCYHPNLDIVYFDNEQASSVAAFRFDSTAGNIEAIQTLSTLPDDFEGENSNAQIHITPSGKFLYATNRGHDSIACFAIEASTGMLRSIGQQATEPTPRVFGLDPEGRFLYAAGQGSGRLASYRINQDSGALTPLETYDVGDNPMWVKVLKFP